MVEEPSPPIEATVEELSSAGFQDFFRKEYPALVALAAAVPRSPHASEDARKKRCSVPATTGNASVPSTSPGPGCGASPSTSP